MSSQVTKYNHSLCSDSTKYLRARLAVRRSRDERLTTLRPGPGYVPKEI